jgi:hypothetical protein
LVADYGELVVAQATPEDELAQRRADKYKGHVAIEGLQAEYDAITELAELTEGQMYAPIPLTFDSHDLYGPDGRSATETAVRGLEAARQKAEKNPNLQFDVERAEHELNEVLEAIDMIKTGSGNTLMVTTNYPWALKKTGQTAPGYNEERELALARFIAVYPDDSIWLISQTLDGSNDQGLNAIHTEFDFEVDPNKEQLGQRRQMTLSPEEQAVMVDRARGVYDREMTAQFDEEFYAGRRPVDYRNTYDFVCQQRDLIEAYKELKLSGNLTGEAMYNLGATINSRFEKSKIIGRAQVADRVVMLYADYEQTNYDYGRLYEEMAREGRLARSQGKSFVACGSTFTANSTEALFGNADNEARGETSWHGGKIYKNSKCVSCEKVKSEVGACHICKDCVEHPKKHKLGTVQSRTGDPKKAKINKESAQVFSLDEARKAREKSKNKAGQAL